MRIKFKEEYHSYKVMVTDLDYAICVKPFNARKTFFYVIVDYKQKIRGKDDYIFNKFDYSDLGDCIEALKELHEGTLKVSSRNQVPLNIEKVIHDR